MEIFPFCPPTINATWPMRNYNVIYINLNQCFLLYKKKKSILTKWLNSKVESKQKKLTLSFVIHSLAALEISRLQDCLNVKLHLQNVSQI